MASDLTPEEIIERLRGQSDMGWHDGARVVLLDDAIAAVEAAAPRDAKAKDEWPGCGCTHRCDDCRLGDLTPEEIVEQLHRDVYQPGGSLHPRLVTLRTAEAAVVAAVAAERERIVKLLREPGGSAFLEAMDAVAAHLAEPHDCSPDVLAGIAVRAAADLVEREGSRDA